MHEHVYGSGDVLPLEYLGGGECRLDGRGNGRPGRLFSSRPRPVVKALGARIRKGGQSAALSQEVAAARLPKMYVCEGLQATLSLASCEHNRKKCGVDKPKACHNCTQYKEWT